LNTFALMQPLQVKIRRPAAAARIPASFWRCCGSVTTHEADREHSEWTRPFWKRTCRSRCASLEDGGGAASAPSTITTFFNARVLTGSDVVNDVQQADRSVLGCDSSMPQVAFGRLVDAGGTLRKCAGLHGRSMVERARCCVGRCSESTTKCSSLVAQETVRTSNASSVFLRRVILLSDLEQVETVLCRCSYGSLETIRLLARFMTFQRWLVPASGEKCRRGGRRNIGGCRQSHLQPSFLPGFS
jgi:hypothetical protein